MNNRDKFIEIYKSCITREGADKFLQYLCEKTDFFEAPASTRFHGAYEGGLLEHSLNVYECLCDFVKHSRFCQKHGFSFDEESLAIVALLHDVCKVNFYKTSFRNVKDEHGKWVSAPYYTIEDSLPYGHGEKSVYIVSGFMRLTRDEAFAIRYHMGFSGNEDNNTVGAAFAKFPLAIALATADMEAAYFIEGSEKK